MAKNDVQKDENGVQITLPGGKAVKVKKTSSRQETSRRQEVKKETSKVEEVKEEVKQEVKKEEEGRPSPWLMNYN